MISKTIIAGLVAIAFVAGSIMTEAAVFAEKEPKPDKNAGIIAALTAIADAITGIEPDVTVEPTPITINAPQGEKGDKGETGSTGATGSVGTFPTIYDVTEEFATGVNAGLAECDTGDKILGGGGFVSGVTGFTVFIVNSYPLGLPLPTSWVVHTTPHTGELSVRVICADTASPFR